MPELDWRDDDGDAAAAGAISPVTLSAPAENKQPHKRHGHGTAMDARGSSILAWLVNLQTHTRTSRCRRDTHRRSPRVVSQGAAPRPRPRTLGSIATKAKAKPPASAQVAFGFPPFAAAAPMRKSGCLMESSRHGEPATGMV